MERKKKDDALPSSYSPPSTHHRPQRLSTPPWATALAWALLGFVLGCALASVLLDPLSSAAVAKTAFDPSHARAQQDAPPVQQPDGQPVAAAAGGGADVPLDAALRMPAARKVWAGWGQVDMIFSFGDSYTATHFNVTEDPQPSVDYPFGNRDALPVDNQNDTTHWINYLRDRYSTSQPIVYNLAAAGALTTTRAYAQTPARQANAYASSFNTQIDIFARYNETRPPFRMYWKQPGNVRWDERRTLFTVWFGVADLIAAIDDNVPVPIEPLLSAYAAGLERLYAAGARALLLLNVPPVHRVYASPATVDEREAQVDALNARIAALRRRFLAHHPDASVFHLDVAALFKMALDKPEAFAQTERLKVLDTFCESYAASGAEPPDRWDPECEGALDEFFWLDDRHVSPAVHDFVAAVAAENCFNYGEGPRFYCT